MAAPKPPMPRKVGEGYDPDEKRDDSGQWTAGGSGSGEKEHHEIAKDVLKSVGIDVPVKMTSGDDDLHIGAGWNGKEINLRSGFLDRVANHDPAAHAEQTERRKSFIPRVKEEVDQLSGQLASAKKSDKAKIRSKLQERHDLLDELKYSKRTYAYETAPTAKDRIKTVIAHEAGHALASKEGFDFPAAVREVGGYSPEEKYAVSTYGASHSEEMVAEITALKHTGRYDEVPEKLRKAYELAIKKAGLGVRESKDASGHEHKGPGEGGGQFTGGGGGAGKAAKGKKAPAAPASQFGQSGAGHPLAGMSRADQVKKLGQVRDQQDEAGVSMLKGAPHGLDMDKFGNDLAQAVHAHASSHGGVGDTMDRFYKEVGEKHNLSKHDFVQAVGAARQAGKVKTGPWAKMLDDIPDPELAGSIGSKVIYYIEPKG